MENKMSKEEIIEILDSYFNRENPPKFVDVSRVPLICQDITTIKNSILKLEESVKVTERDHESRIRLLEKNMWRNAGIASVLGALGTWILQRFI